MKHKDQHNKSLIMYVTGFLLSLILTLAAYFLVINHILNPQYTLFGILFLAIIQLLVQLIFFLDITDGKQRYNAIFFIATIGMILIVVVGSIWIMNHLNYNMTPKQINDYIHDQSGY